MRGVTQASNPSVMSDFLRPQQKLGSVYAVNALESTAPHVMLLVSSSSLG